MKLKDFDPTVYYITYKIKYRHIIVLKSDNIEEVKLAFENIENTDKFIKLKNDIIRNQLI